MLSHSKTPTMPHILHLLLPRLPLPPNLTDCPPTSQALLKMQTEASGAGYAIYWQQSGDVAEVAGYYATPGYYAEIAAAGKGFTFAEASESITFATSGNSPVARVLRSRKPVYLQDILAADFEDFADRPGETRKGIAVDYAVESVAFVPILGGVIEYATAWLSLVAHRCSMPHTHTQCTFAHCCPLCSAPRCMCNCVCYSRGLVHVCVRCAGTVPRAATPRPRGAVRRMQLAKRYRPHDTKKPHSSNPNGCFRSQAASHKRLISTYLSLTCTSLADPTFITSFLRVDRSQMKSSRRPSSQGPPMRYSGSAMRPRGHTCRLPHMRSPPSSYRAKWLKLWASRALCLLLAPCSLLTIPRTFIHRASSSLLTQPSAPCVDVSNLNADLLDAGESYITASARETLYIEGNGPISRAGQSASTLVVPDTQNFPNFQRAALAAEWGVGKITCVPVETGVIEFGTVTKDKRDTTSGAEYQEAVRQYRRSVFMHKVNSHCPNP